MWFILHSTWGTFANFYQQTHNDFADEECSRINFPRLNNLNKFDNFAYYTPTKYNTTVNHKADTDLAIINLNIRGLERNFDNLVTYLNTFDTTFDVIVLTEAHIQNTPRYTNIENMYNLEGYVGYHTKSTIKFGGITLYVKNTFNVNCIPELTKATNFYDSVFED